MGLQLEVPERHYMNHESEKSPTFSTGLAFIHDGLSLETLKISRKIFPKVHFLLNCFIC
jgi:hypothetical protein